MIRLHPVFLSSALLLLSTLMATEAAEPSKRFVGKLKEGQQVSLKEANGRYDIIVMPHLALGHKVIEIGEDYIELLDVSGVTTTIIPIYSIRSITRHELPPK